MHPHQKLQQSAAFEQSCCQLSSFNLSVTQYEFKSKTSTSSYAVFTLVRGVVQSAACWAGVDHVKIYFSVQAFRDREENMVAGTPPSAINCSDFGGSPEMLQPLHLIADCFLTCTTHAHTHTAMSAWYLSCWNIHVWNRINKSLYFESIISY